MRARYWGRTGRPQRAVVEVHVGGLAAALAELVAHHLAVVDGLHRGLLDDLEVDVAAAEADDAGALAVAGPEGVDHGLLEGGLVALPDPAAGGADDLVTAERAADLDHLDGGGPDVDSVAHCCGSSKS
jgi:hypothetical protein